MHALKQGFNYEWRTLAAIAGQRDNAGAAKCAVEALIEKHDWNVVNGICATGLPEVGKHAVDTVFKEGNRVAMEGIAKYGSPEVSEYARQKLKEMKEEK